MRTKRIKKFYLIKDDQFGELKNTFKWRRGGVIYRLCYSDFSLLLDKFITASLEKNETIPSDKVLKCEFLKFVQNCVKFRECLWCSKAFLSISVGHRKCPNCETNDPNPYMVYSSWGGETLP